MKKGMVGFLYSLLVLSLMMSCPPDISAGQESMTLTTFYPAPFGAYDRIRLVPRGGTPSPCDAGTMYVDANDGNTLKVCDGTGPGGGNPLNLWTQNANNLYPTDWNSVVVGIGTNTPDASKRLDVQGDTLLNGALEVAGNSTIDGNLGLGKIPVRKLDVEGDAQVNKLFLKADGANVGELKVQYNSGDGFYYATYAP